MARYVKNQHLIFERNKKKSEKGELNEIRTMRIGFDGGDLSVIHADDQAVRGQLEFLLLAMIPENVRMEETFLMFPTLLKRRAEAV